MKIYSFKLLRKLLPALISAYLLVFTLPVKAEGQPAAGDSSETTAGIGAEKGDGKFNASEVILDHILDSHEWHLMTIAGHKITIPLPVILVSSKGIDVFMSTTIDRARLIQMHDSAGNQKKVRVIQHGGKIYLMEDGKFTKVVKESELISTEVRDKTARVFDFSITKNVVSMLLAGLLLFLLFRRMASAYALHPNKSPRGMNNFLEMVILFMRDEVIRPNLREKTNMFLPYLLTIFFFIWINNLLGLLPFAMNVTGNITFTATLAIFTLAIMMFKSGKHYWGHIFNPPGVPGFVKPILVLVEVLSIITKPFALLIRLFANITAGHLIVLSFLSMIFIFAGINKFVAGGVITPFSVAFATCIYFLELLVAALQAFIFVMLSSLFISEAMGIGQSKEHH